MIGLSPDEDHLGVVAAHGPHLGSHPFPDPFHSRLARLDQQLAAVAPDVEPQEVHPIVEVHDASLVFVEAQPPGCQPRGQPRLDLLRLLTRMAQGQQIVGLC
jgi:hypothetical protein